MKEVILLSCECHSWIAANTWVCDCTIIPVGHSVLAQQCMKITKCKACELYNTLLAVNIQVTVTMRLKYSTFCHLRSQPQRPVTVPQSDRLPTMSCD